MSSREARFVSPEGCVRYPSATAVAGKYWAIFRTQLVNSLAYPIDLLGRSLLIVLFMWIFMNLWRVTYGATGTRSIAGLTLADTMWYLMMAEAVMLSKRDLSETMSEQVKDGSVAYLLNKPFNFILYHFAAGLGDSVLAFGGNLIVGSAVVWLMVGPPPGITGWLFAGVAVVFALLLDFCFSALIGLSAFVVEETVAFRWIYQKVPATAGRCADSARFLPGMVADHFAQPAVRLDHIRAGPALRRPQPGAPGPRPLATGHLAGGDRRRGLAILSPGRGAAGDKRGLSHDSPSFVRARFVEDKSP